MLALVCSTVSSAITGWAVLRFDAGAAPAVAAPPKPAAALAQPARASYAQRSTPAVEPPDPFEDATLASGRASAAAPYPAPAAAPVLATAATTHELVSTLQEQYSNAYFAGRTGLKNDLNAVQTAAAQLQTALADGAPAETAAQGVAKLGSTLDRTITRLENLINNTKDANQVEASRVIKLKLEEMRATLP